MVIHRTYCRNHCLAIIPHSAAARLSISARNQKVLTDTEEVAGSKGAMGWKSLGGRLEFDICFKICPSSWFVVFELSCWSHLYASIRNAVRTAENNPAYTFHLSDMPTPRMGLLTNVRNVLISSLKSLTMPLSRSAMNLSKSAQPLSPGHFVSFYRSPSIHDI